jgi:general secretion pathway protein K
MIAAIVGVAAFGFVAFQMIAQNRGVLAEVRAEAEQAKLEAACDAGLYMAIAGLAVTDVTQRWGIDGRARVVPFGDTTLTITVEDERGKIPLNGIIEEEVHDIFADAGAVGAQLATIVQAYEDWEDTDSTPRPGGAEAAEYAPLGYKPRNGSFRTVGELRMLKGMDDRIYQRVSPAVTTFFGESGGFSESTAQPLALEVLGEVAPNSPEIIERIRELSGQAPVPQTLLKASLVARTLTVRVEARKGATYLKRTAIFELTNNPRDPYWIRYLD